MDFNRIQASIGRKPRSLDHLSLTRRYAVRIADDEELPELTALAERHIPGITNAYEPTRRVHLHHRGSVLAVVRDERIVGAAAFLYLNSAGVMRLQSGTFSYAAPEMEVLTLPGEPAADKLFGGSRFPHGGLGPGGRRYGASAGRRALSAAAGRDEPPADRRSGSGPSRTSAPGSGARMHEAVGSEQSIESSRPTANCLLFSRLLRCMIA